ncbi:catalase family peroxidase [Pseudomonas matsuisoli]|uniref:Catalase-related peroxidase n=1 Tax=Pseudomonas matsuisoli TaxID=1515666 RepID=A0A917PRR3_9PSED|nr:catalase family peroxidase [Pseudomonas matsuisoli]GGJ88583.1 catalase-related peroxidase [Pseudomonas matsuisoli]
MDSSRTPTWRWLFIAAAIAVFAGLFAYVGGWIAPNRLTPKKIVDTLEDNAGVHPGYRRNHSKGICVAGTFTSSGQAADYSIAALFAPGDTPVVGRFALPGGNPYAPDNSVPIRSFALRFTQSDGQQWRTGMNSMPVFPVATPEAFFAQLQAGRPDPATGKPDPARMKAFFDAHPEASAFLKWVKTAKPSASYATETYWGLNAFYFVNEQGERQAVRWEVVPEQAMDDTASPDTSDPNYLAFDLEQRLASGALRWRLLVTLAAPGDPVDDATKTWPANRPQIDAGTLVLNQVQPQDSGECRDINYDPTILPQGIEISSDPLLPARSAAYADSYLRRTGEEAHLPSTSRPGDAHLAGSKHP